MLCSRHALIANYASLTNVEEYTLKAMTFLKALEGYMSSASALAIIFLNV